MTRLFEVLGMALKANILVSGQTRVRRALGRGKRLLILLTEDHSRNVLSAVAGYRERGRCKVIVLKGVTRNSVATHLGLGRTQILAIPEANGLAGKVEALVTEGGDTNE
ncbi:MAG: hypothetical protein ACLFN0_02720 [Thermovirgaceae bacterium]